VPWRISGKPFSSALDHYPSGLDLAVVAFTFWHRPVLDVVEEVILALFCSRPRVYGLHPLPFLPPSLFSDVDGKRRSMSIPPTILVVPVALCSLGRLLGRQDVPVEEGPRADVILTEC